eukprot:TRINITY_DN2626_c0_g1_i2.p1 TRINITY_DN2626_c0_g1~~TRINITY_DN2626_c0_g1_i2.p1  ORF type:complete len:134 (-),score=22.09 TRINITY_DN2626_c0_g1_i2:114-515(-)
MDKEWNDDESDENVFDYEDKLGEMKNKSQQQMDDIVDNWRDLCKQEYQVVSTLDGLSRKYSRFLEQLKQQETVLQDESMSEEERYLPNRENDLESLGTGSYLRGIFVGLVFTVLLAYLLRYLTEVDKTKFTGS